jgi:hypothetical protein
MMTLRLHRLGLALAALVIIPPATAGVAEDLLASGHVKVRARVEPEQVYVGQKVEVVVDLLTGTWFQSAPRYPETLSVNDAIVLPPESFGVNFSERIEGQSYAGQTRRLTIFPTRAGRFEVPPVAITLKVADDNARPTPEFVLRTPPLSFEARLPEAARGLGLVVATPRLRATQRWNRDATGLRMGDALERTISMEIDDSVSMLLPASEFAAPEGVAVYPGRPQLSDSRNRGETRGSRIESVTYLFEREGTFALPEIVIHWWDLRSNRLRSEKLPGLELEVAANTDLAQRHLAIEQTTEESAEEPVLAEDGGPPWRTVLIFAALLAVIAACVRPLVRLATRVRGHLRSHAAADAAHFARFRRVALRGEAGPTLSALYAWLDRAGPLRATTLESLAGMSGDGELARQIDGLVGAAYGHGGSWSPRLLVRSVARCRRAVRSPRRLRAIPVLGSLNPRS